MAKPIFVNVKQEYNVSFTATKQIVPIMLCPETVRVFS